MASVDAAGRRKRSRHARAVDRVRVRAWAEVLGASRGGVYTLDDVLDGVSGVGSDERASRRLAVLGAIVLACGSCTGDDGARAPSGQHEITVAGELLTEDGLLREPGWARTQLLRWDPARVADPSRLRQWDFFTIENADAAVNLTLVDLGFLQAATVGVVDLRSGETFETTLLIDVDDAFVLSDEAFGTASLTLADADTPAMAFVGDGRGSATITIDLASPTFGPAVRGTFTVTLPDAMPYLSVATPFSEDPHLFFFEQKIPRDARGGRDHARRSHMDVRSARGERRDGLGPRRLARDCDVAMGRRGGNDRWRPHRVQSRRGLR